MANTKINLSTVSDNANAYWKSRAPITAKKMAGECSLCPNDAVYYCSQGVGYCLGCWQGSNFAPGTKCAELFRRSYGSALGGRYQSTAIAVHAGARLKEREIKEYWVKGITIIERVGKRATKAGAKRPTSAQPAKRSKKKASDVSCDEYVLTLRDGETRSFNTLRSQLLPLRPGMPDVSFSTFEEVYGTPLDFS